MFLVISFYPKYKTTRGVTRKKKGKPNTNPIHHQVGVLQYLILCVGYKIDRGAEDYDAENVG